MLNSFRDIIHSHVQGKIKRGEVWISDACASVARPLDGETDLSEGPEETFIIHKAVSAAEQMDGE